MTVVDGIQVGKGGTGSEGSKRWRKGGRIGGPNGATGPESEY